MNQYVVGVDGGGTKTDAVLMDISGNLIGMATGGSSNYQAVGGAKLKQEILGCLAMLCHSTNVTASRIGHVFLGLAGAGREKDQREIADLFNDTDYAGKVTVNSDAMVALAGAFGTGPGIIIISGTGSICFGKNREGKVLRSGGWGYLLGDEGGGYFIGREGLIAALKDFDGRGEKTKLRPRLEQHFQLQSIDQIIPLIYQNKIDRVAIADLTPIVFELAREGDSVADEIIHLAGRELGKLAKAVAQRLNFGSDEIHIALIGSVFKQKDLLVGEIAKELYDLSWNVQIGDPRLGPKFGAALLALQKIGVTIDERILKNLEYSIGLVAGRS
jgi:N-acetylglucosamine kinase-like BadF-type ATPase